MIMSIIIKRERYILKLYKKKTDIVIILIAGILSLECILYILILHAPKTNNLVIIHAREKCTTCQKIKK